MISNISKMQVFFKALQFASIKHSNQRRKGQNAAPYINHPIEVANILVKVGIDDYSVLAAAILHDTVQDTDATEEELEKEFGAKIKNIVMECSDDKNLDKAQRKKYQIESGPKKSYEAKLVKIADKISNNGGLFDDPPPKWSPDRVRGYFIWSQAVCANLKGVNQNLDKQINEIFDKSGINALSHEQKSKLLDDYYVSLLKSNEK